MKNPIPRPTIPLPEDWKGRVRSALLHVISLARFAAETSRAPRDSNRARARPKTQNERLQAEISLLVEEIRIKDARLARVPPPQRPHYRPIERMAILELRAARGWNMAQVAEAFLLTPLTVRD